ncbi:hypothetical protein [Pedobacter jamesrossensis]|uniref:hypothetical protein n=1 Tax=Pedobacter jamesrossensis TaxID=1908238 RepID=UPI00361CF1E8
MEQAVGVQFKVERDYQSLPIEEKESYKWIEVSRNTKSALKDVVKGMVIIQDREGDIYEQFALIPDSDADLLIRARSNRTLADKTSFSIVFPGILQRDSMSCLLRLRESVKSGLLK